MRMMRRFVRIFFLYAAAAALSLFRGTECRNILLQQFNNTALAGKPSFVSTVDRVSPDHLRPYTSARFFCLLEHIPAPGVKFAVTSNAGHVNVFVDHHLLISANLSGVDNNATISLSDHVVHSFFNRSLIQIDVTVHESVPSYLTVTTHLDDNNVTTTADTIQCLPIERELDDELYYLEEKQRHEIGWGNWLSEDITSQVLLPHGLAVSLFSDQHFSGPTCNEDHYPLRHGIRAVDGHYGEIEYVKGSTGRAFRLQSANADTTLVIQVDDYDEKRSSNGQLSINIAIPAAYAPRYCSVGASSIDCPGLEYIEWIILNAALDPTPVRSDSELSLSFNFVKQTDDPVFIVLYAPKRKDHDQAPGIPMTPSDAQAFVAAHREKATNYLSGNEVLAGLTAAISWNKIYSPLEGIFTPVFRGRIWSVSVPFAYVLFEWDTYLASFIATSLGDKWVAASNIVRMTLTFWHQGFVPGFWNGKCGEVDKSKPPLGAWALLTHVEKYPDHLWIARFLIRYLEAWNDWWVQQRMVESLIAPGSIRSNVGLSWHCEAHNPIYSAVCETGLDNSPLYDSASFIPSKGLLDYWDVGLSAVYVLDCQSIGKLAKILGLASLDEKMSSRAAITSLAINENLWNDEMGIYLNRKWTDKSWVDIDTKSGARPVAPTSFYPMITNIPSPGQTIRMVQGYLTNPSELGVGTEFDYGMPSISRSSSACHDNRYWRGRTWGPMNFLVYLGLEQYDFLPEVSHAMTDLARQSKNTFLKEWVSHRRIMENYSSSSGEGCDVHDANPFYHWGALLGLIAEMEASRVAKSTVETETS